MVKKLKLVHLYPKEMNIYGDNGNVLVLQKRLEWRGVGADVVYVGVGETIPEDADIIVSGGGQDTGQISVAKDLMAKGENLKAMSKDGVVMLVICGTYQLFGHRFLTAQDGEIKGIGIFDAETIAGQTRLIGNIVIDTSFGELVGYENHSGNTFLLNEQQRLGTVVTGKGNNDNDGSEGAQVNNTFGTYLHGPLLPKNPVFADELLKRALERKYGDDGVLGELPDSIAQQAFEVAKSRPR